MSNNKNKVDKLDQMEIDDKVGRWVSDMFSAVRSKNGKSLAVVFNTAKENEGLWRKSTISKEVDNLVDCRDGKEPTAVMLAALSDCEETFAACVSAGADLTLEAFGMNILNFAPYGGKVYDEVEVLYGEQLNNKQKVLKQSL